MYSNNLDINDIKYFCEIDQIEKTEQWVPIFGYYKYHVSDLGRIKNVYKKNKIILKPTLSYDGYYYVSLRGVNNKKEKIHRIVALVFIPNPENKKTVNHKKGNKLDNRKISLEWNTVSENIQHAFDTCLINVKKGHDRTNSKLTNNDVIAIRKSKLSMQKLANKYNVSVALVHGIIHKTRWKHV